MTSSKGQNKVPITDPKKIKVYELPNKELKLLRKLYELQENTGEKDE